MEEVQDSRDFQIAKAIFMDMKGALAGWTSRMPQMRSRWKNFRLNTRRSGGHEIYSKTATTVGFRSATALATCCVGCACHRYDLHDRIHDHRHAGRGRPQAILPRPQTR